MPNPSVDPWIGRTVAHYEIVSRLGGGGMGVVYRAIDRKLNRTVAVKFLPPQWSHDETAKQRFMREAQAASATHHPNICTIHDIDTAEDGQLFIVMAYYEGETLKQRLEKGPLPIEEALDIAMQVADGLAKAHAQGVVHRDIKPGNLLLTEDGVRIVDFGLATFADALQLTTSGSTLGTAAYMSPEQSRGEESDTRTDVWAAGVVLYEMLSGHVPFRGSHAEAITYAVRNDPPQPLRAERSELPEEVEQLVFRALHKDATIRFQTGRDLARAIRSVRGLTMPHDLRTQIVFPGSGFQVPRLDADRTKRRYAVVAAALVAVLAGVSIWVFIPVDRVTVAVAPVVNRTGFKDLNGFEFALQEELAAALGDSKVVRVMATDRVREILRRFRIKGEATGPEATQAIVSIANPELTFIPTLSNDAGVVVGMIDVLPRGRVREATLTAGPIASALHHETAQGLILQLAAIAEEHVARSGPLRGRIALAVRRWVSRRSSSTRFAALSAAAAFERGLEAYERLEYASATSAFAQAAEQDPRNALGEAWKSRTLLLMRRDTEAADAADRAADLIANERSSRDKTFVEAAVAEAQRRYTEADAAFQALVEDDPENASSLIELGGYLDRRASDEAAADAYLRAVTLAPALAKPDLELCRLYGPTRLNDSAQAKKYGASAHAKYKAVGFDPGVAQAAMCLADTLRNGAPKDARSFADEARKLLEDGAPYQLPRAVYYQAITTFAQNNFKAAIDFNNEALQSADASGNTALQPFIFQNLSAAYSRLGDRRRAVEYTQKTAEIFLARGENQRAATLQANAASMLIDFGDNPAEGFKLVENALRVFQQARDSSGEVLALAVSASYHRAGGRHTAALELVEQALAISRQGALTNFLWPLQVDQSRSHYELGDYATARSLVAAGIESLTGRPRAQGEIWLSQIETRLGDFESARARLTAAASGPIANDQNSMVLLESALGELAYESGRLDEARRHFGASAKFAAEEFPHARSIEALAYEGLLDSNPTRGTVTIERALDRARRTGRIALEARCRVFLGRIALQQRRFDSALQLLRAVPDDDAMRTIGTELRAQVRYWTAQALLGLGNRDGAREEMVQARRTLEPIRARLSPDVARKYAARPDIGRILDERGLRSTRSDQQRAAL